MPIKNVTTHTVRVQLVTGATLPTQRYCSKCALQAKPANTGKIYIGLPAPLGVSNTVSSTVYDVVLDVGQSYALGVGNDDGNPIDLGSVWLDSDNDGEGISYAPETV